MLAMNFAISLSPVRLLGNTTLLTANHYLQRVDVAVVNPDEINRRADIALIRMGLDGPGTTLIDVTLAAHNIHQLGPDYTVGLAAKVVTGRDSSFDPGETECCRF
jgi:hypothetical protein